MSVEDGENLNANDDGKGYGVEHERDYGRLRAGDGASVGDHDHAAGPGSPDEAPERDGADVARLGRDWPSDARGDAAGLDGVQPSLPGLASYSLEAHSGPLPSAEEFARYGLAVPDAPERILRVMERNSQVSADAVERDSKAEAFALTLSSVGLNLLPFVVLFGGIGLLLAGRDIGGYAMIVTGLAPLVAQVWKRLKS